MNDTAVLVRPPDTNEAFEGTSIFTREEVKSLRGKMAWQDMRSQGFRVLKAFFRCSWPCSRRAYEDVRNRAVQKWLEDMGKQGWTLKSKVAVETKRRRAAYGYSGDWAIVPLYDQVEIPVAALFQKDKEERVRLEIPVKG